jgi:hypothetical protein
MSKQVGKRNVELGGTVKAAENQLIEALDLAELNGLKSEYDAIWVVLSTLWKQVPLLIHKEAHALAVLKEEPLPWEEAPKEITKH